MVEVIPSINVPTFEELEERIKRVEPYVLWCHLDVTDGVFSAHPTWREPADLARLETRLQPELHLMVMEPEKILEQWLVPPIRRVILHLEATRDVPHLIQACRDAGIQIGLAVRPGTLAQEMAPWFGKVDLLQVLAVPPGPSGQRMGEEALGKVADLRRGCPRCRIEIDGGVNRETAPAAIAAGADILVAGSALFGAEDMALAIKELGM